MAEFISISGPAVTGKTSLVNELRSCGEISSSIFSPDFHDTTWADIVSQGIFAEFTDIYSDSCYLCAYLHNVVDCYNSYIEDHQDHQGLVFLDGSWLDFAIYSGLSMWYSGVIKPAQEEVFMKIMKFSNLLSRIYITQADEKNYPIDKCRVRGKRSSFRINRPLEIQLYKVSSKLEHAMMLESTDIKTNTEAIIRDLLKLGYL